MHKNAYTKTDREGKRERGQQGWNKVERELETEKEETKFHFIQLVVSRVLFCQFCCASLFSVGMEGNESDRPVS